MVLVGGLAREETHRDGEPLGAGECLPQGARSQGLGVLSGRAFQTFPQGSLGFLQICDQLIVRYGSCTVPCMVVWASPPWKE